MPFTSATSTIQSALTDQGRDLLARSLLGQVSFQFSGFQAGRAGYELANPVIAESVYSGSTQLEDPIFPLGGVGVAPLITIEAPYATVVSPVCRLNRNDALYGIGEIGLYVRIARSIPPADAFYVVGEDYLFALAHTPIMSKTDKTILVFRFVIAL